MKGVTCYGCVHHYILKSKLKCRIMTNRSFATPYIYVGFSDCPEYKVKNKHIIDKEYLEDSFND